VDSTDLVIRNARLMTCDSRVIDTSGSASGPEREARGGVGLIDHGALAVSNGRVCWVGRDNERPRASEEIDARGRLVTPGLVDCHTHAIFAGDRANEFGMRAAGKSYLEIAAAGGGINATLAPTRAATDTELIALMEARLDLALAGGTTTIEVKSGYDLTVAGELRLLRCIAAAQARRRQRLVPTLLAHLIPPERKTTRDAFVDEIVTQLVPRVAADRLATSVDIYCDEGAFTLDETTRILRAAHAAGLRVRGHVGQFKDLGAAPLLAELGALSADHVEQIDDAGITALAGAGTVAVMLPGACVQLRLPIPPIEKLRAAGVPLAIATDLNPGSSNCETLGVQMWLATTHYGMTVEEAWLGVTRHAARALALADVGMLAPGAHADLVIWHADDPAHNPYRYGTNLVDAVLIGGRPIA
jgi:imidazolonepropionase